MHHHLVPGTGAIDFAEVVAAIRATGYDGWLTVELYPFLDDPDAAARQAFEVLRPLMVVAAVRLRRSEPLMHGPSTTDKITSPTSN